jgi:hypothetical protein
MDRLKLSAGTAPLATALLFVAFLGPWWTGLFHRGLPLPGGWPQTAAFLVLLTGFTSVPVFLAFHLARRRELLTRRVWAESLLVVGLVLALKGLWILAFAWTPTRIHGGPVPRAAGAGFLAWAAVCGGAGGLLMRGGGRKAPSA